MPQSSFLRDVRSSMTEAFTSTKRCLCRAALWAAWVNERTLIDHGSQFAVENAPPLWGSVSRLGRTAGATATLPSVRELRSRTTWWSLNDESERAKSGENPALSRNRDGLPCGEV